MMDGSIIKKWVFPGKVLFVDNKFDEIQDVVKKFAENGVSVQFWDSKSDLTSPMTNIRIIIIDLKLDPAQGDEKNDSYFYPAAEVLSKIKGPYLLIILSTDYEEGDITRLKKAYQEYFDSPLYSIGELGIEKDPEFDDFYKKIKSVFEQNDIFKMVLTWERLLDLAKDKALGELTTKELRDEIHAFVKSIMDDVGEKSLSREFVTNMIRFVSRYMNSGNEFSELTEYLKKLSEDTVSRGSQSIPLLQHLHMYYTPDKTEKAWTGDIYKILDMVGLEGSKKHWKYGIVLTPACDIAQESKRPIDTLLLCEGFPLDYHSVLDKDHPFRNLNKLLKHPAEFDGLPEGEDKQKKVEKIVRESANNLPKKYHALWNFKECAQYFGLCFDFQRVRFVDKTEFENGKKENRICRLDSPFVEDLLQKFGSYSTRLGVPSVNSS